MPSHALHYEAEAAPVRESRDVSRATLLVDGLPRLRLVLSECQVVMLDSKAMLRVKGRWEAPVGNSIVLECVRHGRSVRVEPLPPGAIESSDGEWSAAFHLPEIVEGDLALMTAGDLVVVRVPRRSESAQASTIEGERAARKHAERQATRSARDLEEATSLAGELIRRLRAGEDQVSEFAEQLAQARAHSAQTQRLLEDARDAQAQAQAELHDARARIAKLECQLDTAGPAQVAAALDRAASAEAQVEEAGERITEACARAYREASEALEARAARDAAAADAASARAARDAALARATTVERDAAARTPAPMLPEDPTGPAVVLANEGGEAPPGRRPAAGRRAVFALGAVIGIGAVPLAMTLNPVTGGGAASGLDLTVRTQATGEIGVSKGPIAARRGMTPRSPASGSGAVRNQTGKTLVVRTRASVATRDVDESVRVRLRVDGERIFDGTLGELRGWTSRTFTLRKAEERRLQVDARVAEDARDYVGRSEYIVLLMRASPRDD